MGNGEKPQDWDGPINNPQVIDSEPVETSPSVITSSGPESADLGSTVAKKLSWDGEGAWS